MRRVERFEGELPDVERRMLPDRRRRVHLFGDWRWAYRGRRRRLRRQADRYSVQVDWYPARLFLAVLAILLLSAADATMTLSLVNAGLAEEANPLMRPLLQEDRGLFLNLKLFVTGFGLIFIVACSNFVIARRLKTERLIYWILGIYLSLITYELYLLTLPAIG